MSGHVPGLLHDALHRVGLHANHVSFTNSLRIPVWASWVKIIIVIRDV